MTGPSDSSVPQAAPLSSYSPEDRAFYEFWYGHMLNDLMQPPLAGIAHATARYIWDAARRAALPVAPSDADRDAMQQEIDALEELTETLEMGDPHWADAKCFKAAVAAIAALRTRLLHHSEGKE